MTEVRRLCRGGLRASVACEQMDEHLKTLAEAGLSVDAAEEALGEGAHHTAAEHLDTADAHLTVLREAWTEMGHAERTIVGRTAKPLAERLAAARRRLPKLSALSVGAPEVDPDEDVEPGAAPVITDQRVAPPGAEGETPDVR